MARPPELHGELVRNTVLDPVVAERFLPLQFWREYVRYAEALRRYVTHPAAPLRIIVPLRAKEASVPVVSLIVWTKAAQLTRLSEQISVKAVVCRTSGEARARLLKTSGAIWAALGAKHHAQSVEDMICVLDDEPELSSLAAALMRQWKEQRSPRLSKRQLADLLDLVTMVSNCVINEGTLILCGQDQAPLINILASHFRSRFAHAQSGLPVGLYTPLLPFVSGSYILLEDDEQTVRTSLLATLGAIESRHRQLLVAEDMLRVTVCADHPSELAGYWSRAAEARSLEALVDSVTGPLCQWLSGLRQGLREDERADG